MLDIMKRFLLSVLLVGGMTLSTLPVSASNADCAAVSGSCKASCSATETVVSSVTCTTVGQSCCQTAGGGGSTSSADVNIPNPLGFSTVEDFLTNGILVWLQGVIVTLALVFFVIGALMYIMGGADEGNIKKGQAAMTAALIGLALGIGAPTFLQEIYTIFGVSTTTAGPTLVEIALNVLKFLLSIVGILTIIMLVVSGIAYMSSGGDESRAKTAKNMATYAAIGLTLALASLILVRQISIFFL